MGGPRIVLAHASGAGRYRVGRYAVEIAAFEKMVLRPLALALQDPVKRFLVIDEIGKMELLAPSFAGLVWPAWTTPAPWRPRSCWRRPFADGIKARPDVEVIQVSTNNRDRLPVELAGRLAGLAGS
ncbi:MAG: hypothetical protein H5T99_11945 [Moorella sp. (in: Bacteria)]|nr:hypothetical protein [Moorella sp. (in: firmicutes)]